MVFEENIIVNPEAEPCNTEELLVTFYYVEEDGELEDIGSQLVAIHVIKPIIWCLEGVNPSGKNIPPAGSTTMPGPKGGRNDDGFYEMQWPKKLVEKGFVPTEIWAGSRTKPMAIQLPDPAVQAIIDPDIDFVIKLTEAPGAIPTVKMIGSNNGNANNNGQAGAVRAHVTLPFDRVFVALVPTPIGMIMIRCVCLVPPPPK